MPKKNNIIKNLQDDLLEIFEKYGGIMSYLVKGKLTDLSFTVFNIIDRSIMENYLKAMNERNFLKLELLEIDLDPNYRLSVLDDIKILNKNIKELEKIVFKKNENN